MSEEELTEEAFSRVCRLMHERAGIIIPNDKAYLVSQRLSSVAASAKLSIDDLIRG